MNKSSTRENEFLVSVIMPVFNGEKYLAEAIDSVLNQIYPAIELIIVDDGSTDGTGNVIRKYNNRVVYIFKEHSGIGATLNVGISKVQGNYIAFLDADDLWVENKLELQVAAFNNADIDMIFGYLQQFISPELSEKEKSRLYCPDQPMPGYSKNTILVERESFFRVGLFSTDYQLGEFIDWQLRAKYLGLKSLMLSNIVAKRRLHNSNTTGQDARAKLDYARVIKAGLDRSRGNKERK
jgi:glycosyltransferase involved in cell wall biosynthesis